MNASKTKSKKSLDGCYTRICHHSQTKLKKGDSDLLDTATEAKRKSYLTCYGNHYMVIESLGDLQSPTLMY
jgi:hypothetical protein